MSHNDKVIAAQAVVDQMEAGMQESLRQTPHAILLALFKLDPNLAIEIRLQLIRAIGGDDFILCCVMATVIRELQRRAMENLDD